MNSMDHARHGGLPFLAATASLAADLRVAVNQGNPPSNSKTATAS